MKYVFDNNVLISIFQNYFYDRFPSFWERFNPLIEQGEVVSVREVRRELETNPRTDTLEQWVKDHHPFFHDPTPQELTFVTRIFSVQHFQQNMKRQNLTQGGPYADPFIVAKAQVDQLIVVTQEKYTDHGARIPNICEHFEIPCMNLEGFLENEGWKF